MFLRFQSSQFQSSTPSPIFTSVLLGLVLLLSGQVMADDSCCRDGTDTNLPIINFAVDSSELTRVETTKLDRLAAFLEDNPDMKLAIYGHTDSKGDTAYNQRLSERRSQSVAEFLISLGIPRERLTRRGFSESRPMTANASDADRAKNRRVVFAEQ